MLSQLGSHVCKFVYNFEKECDKFQVRSMVFNDSVCLDTKIPFVIYIF